MEMTADLHRSAVQCLRIGVFPEDSFPQSLPGQGTAIFQFKTGNRTIVFVAQFEAQITLLIHVRQVCAQFRLLRQRSGLQNQECLPVSGSGIIPVDPYHAAAGTVPADISDSGAHHGVSRVADVVCRIKNQGFVLEIDQRGLAHQAAVPFAHVAASQKRTERPDLIEDVTRTACRQTDVRGLGEGFRPLRAVKISGQRDKGTAFAGGEDSHVRLHPRRSDPASGEKARLDDDLVIGKRKDAARNAVRGFPVTGEPAFHFPALDVVCLGHRLAGNDESAVPGAVQIRFLNGSVHQEFVFRIRHGRPAESVAALNDALDEPAGERVIRFPSVSRILGEQTGFELIRPAPRQNQGLERVFRIQGVLHDPADPLFRGLLKIDGRGTVQESPVKGIGTFGAMDFLRFLGKSRLNAFVRTDGGIKHPQVLSIQGDAVNIHAVGRARQRKSDRIFPAFPRFLAHHGSIAFFLHRVDVNHQNGIFFPDHRVPPHPFIQKNQVNTAMLCLAKKRFVLSFQSCRCPAA